MSHSARRLTMIALDWIRPKDPPVSLGHASIKALLDERGVSVHSASWAVNAQGFNPDDVSQHVLKHQDFITDLALGAFIWNESAVQRILRTLRSEGFSKPIILGGPQISYVKSGLERYYPEANIFVRGYAEEAMASLMLRKESFESIKGVHYAGSTDLGVSADANLDHIPSPFERGVIPAQRFIRWETKRGCLFRCAFCQHRESDARPVRRSHGASRIEAEIAWITSNDIIQDIAVLDPIFNSGSHYLNVLDQLISHQYTGKIALQCRLEMVSAEFLDSIERLNQTGHVVLECGLQTIHREEQRVIDRGNNMRKVQRALDDIIRRNIDVELSLIFGLPNQTLESFQQSISFCQNSGVKKIQAFPLMLLRGTPLFDRKQELGLIESCDVSGFSLGDQRLVEGMPHVISSPTFSEDDWAKMFSVAQQLQRS